MRSPTDFEMRVYTEVAKIPVGKVITYGALAARLGCGSARAVGQALKRNPQAPGIPCHRVICADRSPGGYLGTVERDARKRTLLEGEGVHFDSCGRVQLEDLLFANPEKPGGAG